MKVQKSQIVSLVLLICILFCQPAFSADNRIVIYYDNNRGKINKKIFGNNVIAYDPTTCEDWAKEYWGYADYGAGIWDPKWNETVKEVVDLAKSARITMLRFPGGCGAHHYIWKNTIGKNRKHFLFGIDEFLITCKAVGAEPVITLSCFEGDEKDKAELVEYLNVPDDGNHKWAAIRANNGHKEPYGVKYFEVGNEDWDGDYRSIKMVLPEEYANRYLKYYSAMKSIDPHIQVGAILYTPEWNRRVMEIIRDKIDFGIIHIYPSPGVDKETLERMDPKDIFSISLAAPMIRDEYSLREAAMLLKEKSGKDVPFAITEYNGGFDQDKPVPYRHCLGTALLNAELIKIFMDPENKVLMANYWQFNNSYWGMIANGFEEDYKALSASYYKRPNYYIFEMYHKHFGDILIKANVKCDYYDISKHLSFKQRIKDFIKRGISSGGNLIAGKWTTKEFRGVNSIENLGVLELDFVDPKEFNYYHSTKSVRVMPGTYYKLSGYIKAKSLNDPVGVCLEVQDSRGWNATKSAAYTDKITGTSDWKYVEVIYRTLVDASGVTIIARRVGNSGPLEGSVYFKDVKFEKFIPKLDTKIPYVSVNASKSADGKKVYLMVINKNMDASITATIDLKDFVLVSKGNVWVLNGLSVDATNEKKYDNVKVTHHEFEIKGDPFEFTFEPHSLTAIEIERARK